MIRSAVVLTVLVGVCLAQRGFVGGWSQVDPKIRPDLLELAHFAVASQTAGLEYYHTVLELTKASQQVVAGVNYKLTLKVAPSKCKVSETVYSKELCQPQLNAAPKDCEAQLYVVPWRNTKEVTSFECN
uniref:Cystatin-1 n=1 Tax=Ornithodoros moubata TaxID=6938 RepID=CYS1_ORNMO|nr:cystatin precursor [Ornithodoros moubata]